MSTNTTEVLSYHPETGGIHAEGMTYPDIHIAVNAYQHLFTEKAIKPIELASQFNKALPSPELPISASIMSVEAEVKFAEKQLTETGFLNKDNSKPLLREVREVYKKQTMVVDELLLRPQIISAWLVETKKIVEKKPDLDILSRILIEEGFERNYLQHAEAILDHLQIHLSGYSSLNDLWKIRGLMFNIRDLLLNPYKIVAAPYKEVAKQANIIINEKNISEPVMFGEEQFKGELKAAIDLCLILIEKSLEAQTS